MWSNNLILIILDQLLQLIAIYQNEWVHRDTLFWKQIITYFFSTLVVIILPYIDMWGLHLPESLSDDIITGVGILMAVVFFITSNGYIARIKAVNEVYQGLIEKLPPHCRRKTIKQIYPCFWGSVLSWRMMTLISIFMFLALIIIGITLLLV